MRPTVPPPVPGRPVQLPAPSPSADPPYAGSATHPVAELRDPDQDAESVPEEQVEDLAPTDVQTALTLVLVKRTQAGDAQAFGELYDRYFPMVYRYVYFRVDSPQVAEDLTSETFLRALRRIGSFTWQGSDIGAWFVTIARNLVADHYKSSRVRMEVTTDDVAAAGSPPTCAGPEDAVLRGLQSETVLAAVRRLRDEQQECVVLRFLQGLSVAETALVMGKNDAAVRQLQVRAVRALGRLLRDGGRPA